MEDTDSVSLWLGLGSAWADGLGLIVVFMLWRLMNAMAGWLVLIPDEGFNDDIISCVLMAYFALVYK
jgi:hypothetical protein